MSAITITYDNYDQCSYECALDLFQRSKFLSWDGHQFKVVVNDISNYNIVYFWILFCVASEYFVKAFFIRNKINIFKIQDKREVSEKIPGKAISITSSNPNISKFLKDRKINYVSEIKTCTLGELLSHCTKIKEGAIQKSLYQFIDAVNLRRYKYLHYFDKVSSLEKGSLEKIVDHLNILIKDFVSKT